MFYLSFLVTVDVCFQEVVSVKEDNLKVLRCLFALDK